MVGEYDGNAGAGDDFRRCLGEAARSKARVVADDHAVRGILILQDIGGDSAGYAAHVLEGVILGDHAAPAVRSEFNLSSHSSSILSSLTIALFCEPERTKNC